MPYLRLRQLYYVVRFLFGGEAMGNKGPWVPRHGLKPRVCCLCVDGGCRNSGGGGGGGSDGFRFTPIPGVGGMSVQGY
jgi:hypothetical protein